MKNIRFSKHSTYSNIRFETLLIYVLLCPFFSNRTWYRKVIITAMDSFLVSDEDLSINPSESTPIDFTMNTEIPSISDIFPDSISVDDSFVTSILEEDTVRKCINDMVVAIENTVPQVKKILSRKRKRNTSEWLVTKRKEANERGNSYVNNEKKLIPEKEVKPPCQKECKFSCTKTINEDLRKNIFDGFYSLAREGKQMFISQSVECTNVARRTTKDDEGDLKVSKKKTSYSYSLTVNEERVKVCKVFYLGTLGISQKIVYNVHEGREPNTGIPKTNKLTTSNASKIITEERKDKVSQHNESFHLIDSHYCGAKTGKQYLEPSLNISKMYDLYKEKFLGVEDVPVKESYYRFIFNNEYNIDFHKHKTDRCDLCELYRAKHDNKIELTPEEVSAQQEHLNEKLAMREEKNRDKESEDILLVVFDLEKVVTLPKADKLLLL